MMEEPSIGDNDMFGGEADEGNPEEAGAEPTVPGTPERTPVSNGGAAAQVSAKAGEKQV